MNRSSRRSGGTVFQTEADRRALDLLREHVLNRSDEYKKVKDDANSGEKIWKLVGVDLQDGVEGVDYIREFNFILADNLPFWEKAMADEEEAILEWRTRLPAQASAHIDPAVIQQIEEEENAAQVQKKKGGGGAGGERESAKKESGGEESNGAENGGEESTGGESTGGETAKGDESDSDFQPSPQKGDGKKRAVGGKKRQPKAKKAKIADKPSSVRRTKKQGSAKDDSEAPKETKSTAAKPPKKKRGGGESKKEGAGSGSTGATMQSGKFLRSDDDVAELAKKLSTLNKGGLDASKFSSTAEMKVSDELKALKYDKVIGGALAGKYRDGIKTFIGRADAFATHLQETVSPMEEKVEQLGAEVLNLKGQLDMCLELNAGEEVTDEKSELLEAKKAELEEAKEAVQKLHEEFVCLLKTYWQKEIAPVFVHDGFSLPEEVKKEFADLSFRDDVEDQITLSLEKESENAGALMSGLTWLMILTACSKFTLTMFPLALVFEEMLTNILPSDLAMELLDSIIKIVLIFLALAWRAPGATGASHVPSALLSKQAPTSLSLPMRNGTAARSGLGLSVRWYMWDGIARPRSSGATDARSRARRAVAVIADLWLPLALGPRASVGRVLPRRWRMPPAAVLAKRGLGLLALLRAGAAAQTVCDDDGTGLCEGAPCHTVEIGLIFDKYPGETRWEITKGRKNSVENDNAVILKESPYYDPDQSYAEASETHHVCLPEGRYTFAILDRNSDGMCCSQGEGRYAVTYQETGEIITHGSEYGTFEAVTFGIPFVTPVLRDADGDGVEDRTKNIIPPMIVTADGLPDACENEFGLHLQTDDYGVETTWELREWTFSGDADSPPDGAVVASGGPYTSNHTYDISYCLYPGKYSFVFYDWQCDGLTGTEMNGYYALKANDREVYRGGTRMDTYWEEVQLEFERDVETGAVVEGMNGGMVAAAGEWVAGAMAIAAVVLSLALAL
ncbi:hypothetical protein ACHAXT_012161 [Thalassiosira profunda]